MMKLTFTLLPWAAGAKSGSGVVRGSGGRTSSQAGCRLTWGTSTNWEARARGLETLLSRSVRVADRGRSTGATMAKAGSGTVDNKAESQTRTSIFPEFTVRWGQMQYHFTRRVCYCPAIDYRQVFTNREIRSERSCNYTIPERRRVNRVISG